MNAPVDLSNCAREPIHIPGAILPHGAMLVLDRETFSILQAAGNTGLLLGKTVAELLDRNAGVLFRADQLALLQDLDAHSDLAKPRHLLDPSLRVSSDFALDASVHRNADVLILEFVAAGQVPALQLLAAMQEMLDGLDSVGSVQDLCRAAAERVRRVTGYDRVMVYRFMADDSGWVVAESREPHLVPFLDLHYPAEDIPAQARALYLRNALRLITQVDYEPALLQPPLNPRNGCPLDMSQATLRDVSPIHREYLRNMGVGASMSISIVVGGRLWGLIACHHYSPRILPRHLSAVCEIFSGVFSRELEVRERTEQIGANIASRAQLQDIMRKLATEEDYTASLALLSPSLLDYIPAGGAAIHAGQRGGMALVVDQEIRSLGATPDAALIASLVDWLIGQMDASGIFATDRLGELWPPGRAITDTGSGVMAISISREPRDFILWFRPELIVTVSWGGDPTKPAVFGPNGDRLTPRKSFEVWQQEVRGRSTPWTPPQRQAAFDLRVALLDLVVQRLNAEAHEQERLHEHQQLLMEELDHRVKNMLANILALATESGRNAGSVADYLKGFEARIAAMAKAHSLLTSSRWESVSLRELVDEELRQYARDGGATILQGPTVLLTPSAALALSLAIHELATNASKYGALSVEKGSVSVTWHRTDTGDVEVRWKEHDGPVVQKPQRKGFGSSLIQRALSKETSGATTLEFAPDGVLCVMQLRGSALIADGPQQDPAAG